MEVTLRVQYWAIISPDAQHTVAYLKSPWATAAAANLRCGQYLALVEPPTNKYDNTFIAYFVQSVRHPLPATYVPIMPCRLGPREPLALDFEWPFAECVVDTSQKLIFDPAPSTTDVSTRKTISEDSSRMFCVTTTTDRKERAQMESLEYRACRKAERDAAGFPDDDSRWTTFSLKSTVAEVRPNQFFPPWSISAQIDYNIGSLGELLPSSQCLDEVKNIERLRALFPTRY
ncbi:hypothetical protein C8R46DRAFT_476482 [Mycena filopes]|nr:hypothetical protein C8R46DRAFT_476482 [Mycena filopes]